VTGITVDLRFSGYQAAKAEPMFGLSRVLIAARGRRARPGRTGRSGGKQPHVVWEYRQEVVQTMRKRIATAAACAAAVAAPVAAQASPKAILPERHPAYEKRYLEVRGKLVERLGLREAGRNIVRDGYLEKNGDIHPATKSEVAASTERMEASLNPPARATETATSSTSYSSGAAASSTVQCESGGDYTAVNPAGYYGAYQFDQQTWDAYAPSGYQGVNPAEAPPAVQDQTAASVPYDAWPSC
jgi:Transglycosylase-like domain